MTIICFSRALRLFPPPGCFFSMGHFPFFHNPVSFDDDGDDHVKCLPSHAVGIRKRRSGGGGGGGGGLFYFL
jgi:hypothetical protein